MDTTTNSNSKRLRERQLLLYCCSGDFDFDDVRHLVQVHRVNVNCVDEEGRTPLMCAARMGRIQVGRFLLENGADLGAVDEDGWTALAHAVYWGRVHVAELLLAEFDANIEIKIHSSSYDGDCSLLGKAIYDSDAGMVALLLRFRANTLETLYRGKTYTAVYLACWMSSMEIVRLLLGHEGGANVNAFVVVGTAMLSPLCKAACRGNLEMVQLLDQHGARVLLDGGESPLVEAIYHGDALEVLRFLLDRIIDDLQRAEGNDGHPLSDALVVAMDRGSEEAFQLLVDRGANVNDREFSFLHCIARDGMGDRQVGWLLRAGADVNLAQLNSGETPLWAAASNGRVDMVKQLLNAGADVNIRDNNHRETPLAAAHRQGHTDVVYDLLIRTSKDVWPRLFGLVE